VQALYGPYILGLTGSIGTGKSETARMFRRLGFSVSNADDIVKDLYENSSLLQKRLAQLFSCHDSSLSMRTQVSAAVLERPAFLKVLEENIHPLVKQELTNHIQTARLKNEKLIVLDIPLLFETGWDKECDGILVVTCHPQVQEQRVLSRKGMTKKKFDILQQRQWPQEDKIARADFVLDTSQGRLHTFIELRQLLKEPCKKEFKYA
jgi:dephospho-CoA kinase